MCELEDLKTEEDNDTGDLEEIWDLDEYGIEGDVLAV